MYINKAHILGNLTKDPELRKTDKGTSVCNFNIATNRSYTSKSGETHEDAQFHQIVCFGSLAENVATYLVKGQQAYVEGRIQTRSWENDNGEKRYRTEIVANNVQFGSKPGKKEDLESVEAEMKGSDHDGDDIDYPDNDEDITPSDIPF